MLHQARSLLSAATLLLALGSTWSQAAEHHFRDLVFANDKHSIHLDDVSLTPETEKVSFKAVTQSGYSQTYLGRIFKVFYDDSGAVAAGIQTQEQRSWGEVTIDHYVQVDSILPESFEEMTLPITEAPKAETEGAAAPLLDAENNATGQEQDADLIPQNVPNALDALSPIVELLETN